MHDVAVCGRRPGGHQGHRHLHSPHLPFQNQRQHAERSVRCYCFELTHHFCMGSRVWMDLGQVLLLFQVLDLYSEAAVVDCDAQALLLDAQLQVLLVCESC